MKVKGMAFLGRKAMFVKEHGEEAWSAFLARFRETHPDLPADVLSTTLMELGPFLALNDALVEEHYRGDPQAYWRFGALSADWAFTDGPYRSLVRSKDYPAYVAHTPALYRNYFVEGEAGAVLKGDVVDVHISGIPADYRHVYLEYTVLGFFERGLEMTGGHVVDAKRLTGFSLGDEAVHYEFRLGGA